MAMILTFQKQKHFRQEEGMGKRDHQSNPLIGIIMIIFLNAAMKDFHGRQRWRWEQQEPGRQRHHLVFSYYCSSITHPAARLPHSVVSGWSRHLSQRRRRRTEKEIERLLITTTDQRFHFQSTLVHNSPKKSEGVSIGTRLLKWCSCAYNNGKTSTWKMIPPSVLLLLLLDHPLTSTSISTWGNCIGIFHTPASCVSSMLWVGGWYVIP